MKYFLLELKKFGKDYGLFDENIVGKFGDASSQNFSFCTFLGVDGDEFKNQHFAKYFSQKPKSCDVIKFLEEQIDFIEFKTLYIQDVKIINTKINDFELTKKLEGSYELLKKVVGENDFVFTNKEDKIQGVRKDFIVSIYLHGFDEKDILGFTQKLAMIKRNLRGYFQQYPMPFGENFSEPKFMRMEEIEIYYH